MPLTAIQRSSFLLCLATSSSEYSWSGILNSCFLLGAETLAGSLLSALGDRTGAAECCDCWEMAGSSVAPTPFAHSTDTLPGWFGSMCKLTWPRRDAAVDMPPLRTCWKRYLLALSPATRPQLTADEQAVEGLLAVAVETSGLVVDLDTTHGEVQYGLHQCHVEGVVDLDGEVVVVLLAEGVLCLTLGIAVVVLESLAELLLRAANVLGERLAGHLLHQTTARVMSGVEVENVGSLAVEHETDRPQVFLLLLPHLAGDVITVLQLVGETLALAVQQQTTLATESLCSQELRLSSWVLGVDKTCRVDLHRLHVDAVRTNVHQHLVAVTSGVRTVGGREVEICGVSASGQYNWALKRGLLPVERVCHTVDLVTLLVDSLDLSLLDELNTLRLAL
ncbi:Flavocytochrome c [Hortaea werneckii]|nr:Flavocytochrome c [Hortaea werneckii]